MKKARYSQVSGARDVVLYSSLRSSTTQYLIETWSGYCATADFVLNMFSRKAILRYLIVSCFLLSPLSLRVSQKRFESEFSEKIELPLPKKESGGEYPLFIVH